MAVLIITSERIRVKGPIFVCNFTEAKRHLQVITIASLFLDKWHARLIPWPRGTRAVKSDG